MILEAWQIEFYMNGGGYLLKHTRLHLYPNPKIDVLPKTTLFLSGS
jgi:hypothetical protein